MQPPKTIHNLSINGFNWVNVARDTEEETLYLEKIYQFHPLDIKDCLPPLQRPKITPRKGYLFMILVFPVFNRRTKEIDSEEVDFFIKKDMIITVHSGKIQALQNFFEILELNREHCAELMSNPAYFLAQLLDELFDSCFPMLNHISNDLELVSKKVLKGYTKETIYEILRLKNNVVYFRKAMQPHRDLMNRLQGLLLLQFPIEAYAHYFQRLVDHSKEIWDNLETYNYAVDALHQTHETLISCRLNEIVKTLTIFSVIIFLATFIANIFIIPARYIPIIGMPFDFWIIGGIMLLGALIAFIFFRKKQWL